MIVSDMGKLVILGIIATTIVVGLALGAYENTAAAWSALTGVIGYLIGNGTGAVRGQAPSPVIVPHLEPHEIATVTGKHTEGTS